MKAERLTLFSIFYYLLTPVYISMIFNHPDIYCQILAFKYGFQKKSAPVNDGLNEESMSRVFEVPNGAFALHV